MPPNVSERTFLHWSTWTNAPDEVVVDTGAWPESTYWGTKVGSRDWCRLPAQPDGSVRVGNVLFSPSHEMVELLRQLKYTSELLKEYVFEEVRQREFRELPSRRRCMYFLDASNDPDEYAAKNGMTNRPLLYGVEVLRGRLHRGKLAALNCNVRLHGEVIEHARRFWTHADPAPDTEVLFEGICRLRRLRPSQPDSPPAR
jgi:Protein of unknown function (DUF2441)